MCGIFLLIFQLWTVFKQVSVWILQTSNQNKDSDVERNLNLRLSKWSKLNLSENYLIKRPFRNALSRSFLCVKHSSSNFRVQKWGSTLYKFPELRDPFHPRKPNENSFWQPCKSKLRVTKQSTSKLYYEKFILSKTRDSKNNQWVIMDTIGIYEYNSKDLIGHGAFAVVYKGRVKMVSHKRQYLFWLSE